MSISREEKKGISPVRIITLCLISAVLFAGCTNQEASNTATDNSADVNVTVVKARFILHKGANCAADRLEEVTLKQSLAPPGAVHSAASIVGREVADDVPPGALIREKDLVPVEKPALKPGSEQQKTAAPTAP